MVTADELHEAVRTAVELLNPSGVLHVVEKPAETFQINDFAYTGKKTASMYVTPLKHNNIDPRGDHGDHSSRIRCRRTAEP